MVWSWIRHGSNVLMNGSQRKPLETKTPLLSLLRMTGRILRLIPDRSARYQPHNTLRHQPSFNGRYPRYTYAPHTYVPASPPRSTPSKSCDASTIHEPGSSQCPVIAPINTLPNHSSDFQDHGGMTSAMNIPNTEATLVAAAENLRRFLFEPPNTPSKDEESVSR